MQWNRDPALGFRTEYGINPAPSETDSSSGFGIYPPIVFFGTPAFAAEILNYLIDHQVPIRAIVTQPDRPQGRSLQIMPSAVKNVASHRLPDVPIFQPKKCSEIEFLQRISLVDAVLYVVVAFGQILPQTLLQIPPLGCINIHASLLPKYRGAAPIQRSLMNGDAQSGVTIQKMVKELDAGDVIAEARVQIPFEMTYGELEKSLCACAKPLLLQVLTLYQRGVPAATAQDLAQVTYAAKISPEEGKIHWDKAALTLHHLIRALNPRPGCWCVVNVQGENKRLKIFRSHVVDAEGTPGELLSIQEPIVACGQGALHLLDVQPEGKSRMSGVDWLRGAKRPIQFIV